MGGQQLTVKRYCQGQSIISCFWKAKVEEERKCGYSLIRYTSEKRRRCTEYMEGSITICGMSGFHHFGGHTLTLKTDYLPLNVKKGLALDLMSYCGDFLPHCG